MVAGDKCRSFVATPSSLEGREEGRKGGIEMSVSESNNRTKSMHRFCETRARSTAMKHSNGRRMSSGTTIYGSVPVRAEDRLYPFTLSLYEK